MLLPIVDTAYKYVHSVTYLMVSYVTNKRLQGSESSTQHNIPQGPYFLSKETCLGKKVSQLSKRGKLAC